MSRPRCWGLYHVLWSKYITYYHRGSCFFSPWCKEPLWSVAEPTNTFLSYSYGCSHLKSPEAEWTKGEKRSRECWFVMSFQMMASVLLNGRLWRHVAVCDRGGSVHLTSVWHGHISPSDSTCARMSLPAPSSDSPCVTEHLTQHCRVSSLAPSPHSTSPCCHWVKGGKKIHSSPTNGSKWVELRMRLRPAEEVGLSGGGDETVSYHRQQSCKCPNGGVQKKQRTNRIE